MDNQGNIIDMLDEGHVLKDSFKLKNVSLKSIIDEIDAKVNELPSQQPLSEQSSKIESSKKVLLRQYIIFNISEIDFMIPIKNALEIAYLPDITPLPNLPNWILGISNLRGDILSIVDLISFFGLSKKRYQKKKQLIVMHNNLMKIGITVDRIKGMIASNKVQTNIQQNPFKEGTLNRFVSNVFVIDENKFINILDVDELFKSKEMDAFKKYEI